MRIMPIVVIALTMLVSACGVRAKLQPPATADAPIQAPGQTDQISG